jgi:hypothetical protein
VVQNVAMEKTDKKSEKVIKPQPDVSTTRHEEHDIEQEDLEKVSGGTGRTAPPPKLPKLPYEPLPTE